MKNKKAIIRAARKFASKGQIDAAITEWAKLINDCRDGNIHNTIGDLYLKKNKQNDAIESFSRAAAIFREDGFFPKAIAIYKKILNIAPNNLFARITQAELNAERGFKRHAIEDLRNIADKLARDNKTEEALDVYEKTVHLAPDDTKLNLVISELSLRLGKNDKAIKGFTMAASECTKQGDLKKAREYYLKLIEIEPGDQKTLLGLAHIEEKEGEIGQAVEYLSRVVSQGIEDKKLLIHFSDLAIKTGRPEDAIQALETVLRTSEYDLKVKKMLGLLYLECEPDRAWEELEPCIDDAIADQEWDSALEMLNNFRQINSETVIKRFINLYRAKGDSESLFDELLELAEHYDIQGSQNDSLRLYREAAELKPEDTKLKGTIDNLEKTLNIEPPVGPENNRAPGKHEEMFHDTDITETSYKETIDPELAPGDEGIVSPYSLEERKAEAESYAEHGEIHKAIKLYEELLVTFPGDEDIASSLNLLKATGTAASSQDETPGMKDVMPETGEPGPEERDLEAHFQAALSYKRQGRLSEAIDELRISVEDPDNILRNSRMLALCYIERGSYPSAIEMFKNVIKNMADDDPGYLDIMYELAEAYINNNDTGNALDAFISISGYDPAFRDVPHKLEILRSQVVAPLPASEAAPPKKSRISYL